MKRTLLTIAAASAMFASCQDAPKADTATATEAQAVAATTGTDYTADVAQTKVEFVGTKPVGKHRVLRGECVEYRSRIWVEHSTDSLHFVERWFALLEPNEIPVVVQREPVHSCNGRIPLR